MTNIFSAGDMNNFKILELSSIEKEGSGAYFFIKSFLYINTAFKKHLKVWRCNCCHLFFLKF